MEYGLVRQWRKLVQAIPATHDLEIGDKCHEMKEEFDGLRDKIEHKY